jgi:hypothetical protein
MNAHRAELRRRSMASRGFPAVCLSHHGRGSFLCRRGQGRDGRVRGTRGRPEAGLRSIPAGLPDASRAQAGPGPDNAAPLDARLTASRSPR